MTPPRIGQPVDDANYPQEADVRHADICRALVRHTGIVKKLIGNART